MVRVILFIVLTMSGKCFQSVNAHSFTDLANSYNMLLNMLRVEDADPENVLKASFHQYQVRSIFMYIDD